MENALRCVESCCRNLFERSCYFTEGKEEGSREPQKERKVAFHLTVGILMPTSWQVLQSSELELECIFNMTRISVKRFVNFDFNVNSVYQ